MNNIPRGVEAEAESDPIFISDPDEIRQFLTKEKAGELADLLLERNINPVAELHEETHRSLQEAGVSLSGHFEQDHPIRKTKEWEEAREWLIDRCDLLLEARNLILAIVDGKFAGIVGIEGRGYMDGREVYEIVHGIVDPEFRGQKISSKLIKQAIELIRQRSPDGYALCHTKQLEIIYHMKNRKAEELAVEKYTDIDYPDDDETRDEVLLLRSKEEQDGWKAYLIDVKSN